MYSCKCKKYNNYYLWSDDNCCNTYNDIFTFQKRDNDGKIIITIWVIERRGFLWYDIFYCKNNKENIFIVDYNNDYNFNINLKEKDIIDFLDKYLDNRMFE